MPSQTLRYTPFLSNPRTTERERERERGGEREGGRERFLIKLYFSTVKILAQRPTHISAVVKYYDRRI